VPGEEPPPFTGTQVVTRPATMDGVIALRDVGALVNLGGDPLVVRDCEHCPPSQHRSMGETCPGSLPCTSHNAEPGKPCLRPGGHQVPGGYCTARAEAAEQVDCERELAADPTLPAPWPGHRAHDSGGTPPVQLALDFEVLT
jgi:hypothetical protein